jgi:N6-adenosine-specific RNA methylase IME4
MTVSEIARLPVAELADDDAHLYLWTTQRYLQDAFKLVHVWRFSAVKLLVWCKPPSGFAMGGAWGNACEFVVFARRGQVPMTQRVPRDWWEWPRTKHSAKPDAFLDLVERVSPGPYAELFSRRARFGWEYPIGDQALGGEAA